MLEQVIYHIIIIAVGIYGIWSGYRKGLMRQMGSLIAITFAIVAAFLLSPFIRDWIMDKIGEWLPFNIRILICTLSVSIIFFFVYFILSLILKPLTLVVKILNSGIVNSIAGAIFRLFKYMIFLSLAYNIILDLNPRSSLVKSTRDHDGNVVEGVVKLAPLLMNFPDGEEVGYYQQLEDAKKIS